MTTQELNTRLTAVEMSLIANEQQLREQGREVDANYLRDTLNLLQSGQLQLVENNQ